MKNKITIILSSIFVFFLFTGYLRADDEANSNQKITQFEDKSFTFKATYTYADLSLLMLSTEDRSDVPDDGMDLNYYPDEDTEKLGFEVSYQAFTFSCSFSRKTFSGSQDMFLSYFERKFGAEAFYQYYKGVMLADNDGNLNENLSPNTFDDMKMYNAGISLYYFLFDDFSYKAAFYQSEKQNRFGWSPFLKVKPQFFRFKNSDFIVPDSQKGYWGDYGELKGGDFYNGTIAVGLGGTIPIWNFYLSAMSSVGIAFNHQIIDVGDTSITSNEKNFYWDIKISCGFNSDSFFAGFWWMNDSLYSSLGPYDVQLINQQVRLFVGFRY